MVETGKRSPKEAARFRQRVKQVVIGKMTHGYRNYTKLTPKGSREEEHMDTPHVSPRSIAEVSKREFETAVRTWRKFLHQYDDSDEPDREEDEGETGSNTLDTIIEEHVTATPDMFPAEWIALLPEIFTSGKYVETRVKRRKPTAEEEQSKKEGEEDEEEQEEQAASDDDDEDRASKPPPSNPLKKRRSRNRRARQRLANALKAQRERDLLLGTDWEPEQSEEQPEEQPDTPGSTSADLPSRAKQAGDAAPSSAESDGGDAPPTDPGLPTQPEDSVKPEHNHLNPFAAEFRVRRKQHSEESDRDFIRAHLHGAQCYEDLDCRWNHRSGHQAAFLHGLDRHGRCKYPNPAFGAPPPYSDVAWHHHGHAHHGHGHAHHGHGHAHHGFGCLPVDHFRASAEHSHHQTLAAYTRHLLRAYAVPPPHATGYPPPPQHCHRGRRPCAGHFHLQDLSAGPGPSWGRDLLAFNSYLLSEHMGAMVGSLGEGEIPPQHDAPHYYEPSGLLSNVEPETMHSTADLPTAETDAESYVDNDNDGPPSLRDADEEESAESVCSRTELGPEVHGVTIHDCEACRAELDQHLGGLDSCKECDDLIAACTSMLCQTGPAFDAAAEWCEDCSAQSETCPDALDGCPLACPEKLGGCCPAQDEAAICRLCNFINAADQAGEVSTASVGITAEQSCSACEEDDQQTPAQPWCNPRKRACATLPSSAASQLRPEAARGKSARDENAACPQTGDVLLADLVAFAKEFRI